MTISPSISTADLVTTTHHGREYERVTLARDARRTRWLNRISLVLPLLGAAAGAWLLAARGRRSSAGLGALGASLGFGLLRWQLQRFVTEKVAYRVEATLGEIELRRYPAQVWAETVVERATWDDALSTGFRRLAAFIFGENEGPEQLGSKLLALATPALPRTGAPSGETLSMTTPVLATLGEDARADRTIAFVMPADRQLDDLPRPHDRQVQLRAVPERLVAALPFRGDYKTLLPGEMQQRLLHALSENGIPTRGEVRFAGYDPPTTLPALRRNEVLVDIDTV